MSADLATKEENISRLEEKIYLLEESSHAPSSDFVSRAQVEEMERMFSDTVEQLLQRVMLLEASRTTGDTTRKKVTGTNLLNDSDEEGDDDEMAYLDRGGPILKKKSDSNGNNIALPPAVPSRPTGNVRFEPGKVRANNSSHHVGLNIPNVGVGVAKNNSRRY